MADFEVVLPITTEEWQRDMNIAYNQALEDMANSSQNKPYWDDEHNLQAIPIDYIDEVLEDMVIK